MHCARYGRWLCLILLLLTTSARADLVVAVAANFKPALTALLADFDSPAARHIRLVSAGTGSLYAQIINGAPYDMFFAADQQRIDALADADLVLADTRVTYAVGKLVLITRADVAATEFSPGLLAPGRTIAIANPRIAPYGAAARQVLAGLPHGRVAELPNVAAAYSAFQSGAADVALVAASLVANRPGESDRILAVPAALHEPLLHDAIVLRRTAHPDLARELLAYLAADRQQARLSAAGYRVPDR